MNQQQAASDRAEQKVQAIVLAGGLGTLTGLLSLGISNPSGTPVVRLTLILLGIVSLGIGAVKVARYVALAVVRPYRAWPPIIVISFQLTGVISGRVDTVELLIIALSCGLAINLLIDHDAKLARSPINALNALLLVSFFISLLALGGLGVGSILRRIKALILFFLVLQILVRHNALSRFLSWLVIISVGSSVLAIIQSTAWLFFRVKFNLLPADELVLNVESTPFGLLIRSPGLTFGYPVLAFQLGLALMVLTSIKLNGRLFSRGSKRRLNLAIVIVSAGLLTTLSIPVALGCIVGLLVMLILQKPKRLVFFVFMGTLAVPSVLLWNAFAPGGLTTLVDEVQSAPKAEIDRIRLNRDTIERLSSSHYLWTGRGIGSGHFFTGQHRRWPAHHEFLLITAELGVLGLALYTLIFGWVAVRLIALNWLLRSGTRAVMPMALTGGYVVAVIQAQFNAAYLDPMAWVLFAAVEALWIRTQRRREGAG